MSHPTPSRMDTWLVQLALSSSAPRAMRRWARRKVTSRPGARHLYDEVATLGAVLHDDKLPDAQRELVEDALFSDWPAEGAMPTSAEEAGGEASTAGGRSWTLWGGAAAAACAVLLVATQMDGVQHRGGDTTGALGVTFSCLVGEGTGYRVEGATSVGAEQAVGALRCPSDSILSLAGTNLRDTAAGVFVVGVDDDGDVHWLAPFAASSPSQAVPPGTRSSSFDVGVPLESLAGKRLTFYILLDDELVSHAEVSASLDDAERRGVRLESLARLPVDVDEQARLHLEVARR